MAIPFEAFLPYAIMFGVSYAVSAFAPNSFHRVANESHYGYLDVWRYRSGQYLPLLELSNRDCAYWFGELNRDFRLYVHTAMMERGIGGAWMLGIGKVRIAFGRDFFDTDMGLVMERDRRLTGSLRGQVDNAVAPPGFELSSAWKLEKRIY